MTGARPAITEISDDDIIKDGHEADYLLNHYLISGFFKHEEAKAYKEFMTLDLGDGMGDYRRTLAYSKALKGLKHNLEQYIEKANQLILKEQDIN